jgi:hypothetical protein
MSDWRDKIKQIMDKVDSGDWDDDTDTEPQVIVIPRENEADVFKLLTELGFDMPELGFDMPELDAIDTEIEKLIDAGKHVAFEDVERIH